MILNIFTNSFSLSSGPFFFKVACFICHSPPASIPNYKPLTQLTFQLSPCWLPAARCPLPVPSCYMRFKPHFLALPLLEYEHIQSGTHSTATYTHIHSQTSTNTCTHGQTMATAFWEFQLLKNAKLSFALGARYEGVCTPKEIAGMWGEGLCVCARRVYWLYGL